MNKIIQNIATMFIGIAIWTWMPQETYAQCKIDNNTSIKGEFSINGSIKVKDDGNGFSTAPNNIPIKICEGEQITLKNTLPITALTTAKYWIMEQSVYNSRTTSLASVPSSADVSYSNLNGDVSVKMIAKSADPAGLSFYGGPGKYVIVQYDNSTTATRGNELHHACQVIEIIKPQDPEVKISVCSGNEVQITFSNSPNNNYEDYRIQFNATVGSNNPILNTGKPTSYPFTVKSGSLITDNQDRVITVEGVSATGGCPVIPKNLGKFSINAGSINKPQVNSIYGTSQKGEFKLVVSPQNNISRNVFMRDPAVSPAYNYTSVFQNYGSTATSGFDSVIVKVPNGDKQYCFQVEALDLNCPSTGSGSALRSSEEICTTPAEVKPESNKNIISWYRANGTNPTGINTSPFGFYQVERLNADGTVDKLFPLINTISETILADDQITCGQEYTYRVQTNYGSASFSQMIKVKAISDDIPTKIPRFFATMTNDAKYASIQGQFDPTNVPVNIKANNYKFYRADALNSSYKLLKIGNQLINDSTAEVDKKSYCYYMTWTNLCEKESSPSEKVCTVNLKAVGATINWTKETSISAGTDSYIVQRVNPTNGTNIKELASNLKNIYAYNTQILPETEGQEIYIQIESRPVGWNVISGNTLPSTLSNIIKIFRPSLSMSPQIFTPNGDGQNDKFMVRGKFIQSLKMSIYDRWGNVIFYEEMNGYPTENNQNESTVVGWDGTMNNGNKAIEGTYAYKIEIVDTIGQISTKEGALLLAY